jgi:DNA topoisomerase IA
MAVSGPRQLVDANIEKTLKVKTLVSALEAGQGGRLVVIATDYDREGELYRGGTSRTSSWRRT